MALLHKFYIISAILLHFIKPLIIHAPAAPVCLTSFMFSLEIPPIAYTGIDTFSQIFCKNIKFGDCYVSKISPENSQFIALCNILGFGDLFFSRYS
jgi:hypothetical protein